jgi:hypothetical protein
MGQYQFKAVITDNEDEINKYLEEGWTIQSVTAERHASSRAGKFLIIFKK